MPVMRRRLCPKCFVCASAMLVAEPAGGRAGHSEPRRITVVNLTTQFPGQTPHENHGLAVMTSAEVNTESERQAAAQVGHPGAHASAEELETGETDAH
jgi:hypothetical protein